MIRVAKSSKAGGCNACDANGEVLVMHFTRRNATREVRLCSPCASVLLAETVRADGKTIAPTKATGARKRHKRRSSEALGVACPLCGVDEGEPCIPYKGTDPNSEGVHFSRIAEFHRGGPLDTSTTPVHTPVRNMAPHVPARKSSKPKPKRVRIPKPYKARRPA